MIDEREEEEEKMREREKDGVPLLFSKYSVAALIPVTVKRRVASSRRFLLAMKIARKWEQQHRQNQNPEPRTRSGVESFRHLPSDSFLILLILNLSILISFLNPRPRGVANLSDDDHRGCRVDEGPTFPPSIPSLQPFHLS